MDLRVLRLFGMLLYVCLSRLTGHIYSFLMHKRCTRLSNCQQPTEATGNHSKVSMFKAALTSKSHDHPFTGLFVVSKVQSSPTYFSTSFVFQSESDFLLDVAEASSRQAKLASKQEEAREALAAISHIRWWRPKTEVKRNTFGVCSDNLDNNVTINANVANHFNIMVLL